MTLITRELPPSHLVLKIKSFSLLDESGHDKYESPEFHAGNYKWRLVIYPNGHGNEKPDGSVSVYLAISGTGLLPDNWEVNVVFTIFILNEISGNYQHTPGYTRRFFGLKTEWGVPNFMSKGVLMNPSKGFLINDCCVFGAEVFVIDNIKAVTRCLSFKVDEKGSYKHAIKISDFSSVKKASTWNSDKFTVGSYKWKFNIYPNGNSSEAGRSLSVFLEYVPSKNKNSDERVKVRYTICLKNQLDHHKNRKRTSSDWFSASSLSLGWAEFLLLDEFKSAGGGFLVDDTCLFDIEITVLAVAK